MTDPARTGWTPRAAFWDGGFLGMGVGRGVVPPHSHHAIQVTISLEGPVGLAASEGEWRRYEGAIVMADRPHQFAPDGNLVALLFVDPETKEGRWLRRSLATTVTEVPPARLEKVRAALRAFWEEPPGPVEMAEVILDVVRGLCAGPPPQRAIDERIARALAIIRQMDAPKVRLEEVADAVFLSPSRFQHLFRDEIGLPFRRYVLWRKLSRALLEVGRGSNLSAAAHAAGFADSAHLTRTAVQMFGIPPTLMLAGGEFWEIPGPFEIAARSRATAHASPGSPSTRQATRLS